MWVGHVTCFIELQILSTFSFTSINLSTVSNIVECRQTQHHCSITLHDKALFTFEYQTTWFMPIKNPHVFMCGTTPRPALIPLVNHYLTSGLAC